MQRHLETGQRLGKYVVHAELGRGGMGVVYSAEDTVLGRIVAIKVLPPSLLTDDAFVKRFRNEAKTVASLSHPNVVHIHTFDVIDGIPVIEMEYIEGGSLSCKLRRDFVSASEVAQYSFGIASALSYCHSLNAIHRDIKPSNILIDKLNRARLADFGIAKVLLEMEQSTYTASASGVFRGTPLYSPPEAWEGEEPTPAWDIYGLGAVMFQGLTGALPYEANTPLQLVKKIATQPVPSVAAKNPAISGELACLVEEMLQMDPGKRVRRADVVCSRIQAAPEFSLEAGQGSVTIAVPRPHAKPPRISRVRRPVFRSRRVVLSLALVCAGLMLVSAVGVYLWVETGQSTAAATPPAEQLPVTAAVFDLARLEPSAPVEAVLNQTRNLAGADGAILDAQFQGENARAPEDWLLCRSARGQLSLIASGEAGLAKMDLVPLGANDEFAASGNWAAYQDLSATVFRHGTVSGTLRWQPSTSTLIGTLRYVTEQDGVSSEFAVSANAHPKLKTDIQFLAALEDSEYASSLLYRELLPRRGAQWAGAIETLLPCTGEGTAPAARIRADDGPIQVDGMFTESVWSAFNTQDSQRKALLVGVPRALDPTLGAAASQESLYFAVRCKLPATKNPLVFELRLLGSYPVPLSAAPIFHLRYTIDGSETLESLGDAALLRPGASTFVSKVHDGWLQLEGQVPLAACGGNATANWWRCNAVLLETRDEAKPRAVCRWGYPDDTQVRHGVLLRFR